MINFQGLMLIKIFFIFFLVLSKIIAQIALPTFHGVQKYHPPPNYGFNFDGIDDIVDCGDINSLDHADYFTVMFWFKRTDDKDSDYTKSKKKIIKNIALKCAFTKPNKDDENAICQ